MSHPLQKQVEERIREWIRDGRVDHLPGAGKPLRLEVNPFLPPELRIAFKILQDAGYVPPWVEARRQMEAAEAELAAHRERWRAWWVRQVRRAMELAPARRAERIELLWAVHRQEREVHRELIERANRARLEYDYRVPSFRLRVGLIQVEEALAAFDALGEEALAVATPSPFRAPSGEGRGWPPWLARLWRWLTRPWI